MDQTRVSDFEEGQVRIGLKLKVSAAELYLIPIFTRLYMGMSVGRTSC